MEFAKKDDYESMMIQASNGIHPLITWIERYYKDEYKDQCPKLTEESVISEMKNYMPFALEKAIKERGLSANRSVWKYLQWLWLLEDTEFDTDLLTYRDYGLSVLKAINKKYKLEKDQNT